MIVPMPVFSEPVRRSAGSYKKWLHWKTRFTALLQKKGVAHMLTHENELDRKVNDPTLPVSPPMTALMKANATAWYLLVSALSGEPLDLICGLPDSHVGKAWKLLTAKYEKEGMTDLPYLLTQLFQCKWWSKDVDPSIWLADMRAINSRIVAAGGQEKSDAEWIALIQSNTAIPEFHQLYTFLNVANKTRKADWETEICKMWDNQFRSRRMVPAVNNNILRMDDMCDAAYRTSSATQNVPLNQPAAYKNQCGDKNNHRRRRRGRTPNPCSRRGAKINRQVDGKASNYVDSAYQGEPHNNNAEQCVLGGLLRPSISRQSCGQSNYITTRQHKASYLYFLGNLAHKEIVEGHYARHNFNRWSANTLGNFKPDVKAHEHKPSRRVTAIGHCEEYCPEKLFKGCNNEPCATLLNNHDEVKDYWKTILKDHDTENVGNDFASERYVDLNAPQVVPMYAIDNDKVTQKEHKERVASESANSADTVPHQANFCVKKLPRSEFESNSEDEEMAKVSKETNDSSVSYPDTTDTEDESELEGQKLLDNQEQSVPPELIAAGRMVEDPCGEINIPMDEPTIHRGKMKETVITPRRRTIAPKVVRNETINNIFPPNKVGRRTRANGSPESLNGPTLAQQRQKLRDLRTAVKIRLDNYVRKEVGNLQVGRTRVARSTQPISTKGLAQNRQTLRDLRADIKVRLDDYVHRETRNPKSLQHLSGTENVKTPPTTLGQVQTSRYMTVKQPVASTQTPMTRLRRSRQRTRQTEIKAHFVFDRGKAGTIYQHKKKKQMQ
jgi:hypothetical protein